MTTKAHARAVATRFNATEVLVPEERIGSVEEVIRIFLDPANDINSEVASGLSRDALESAYGVPSMAERKPFVFFDGNAVIPVHGVLINRFSSCWGFVTGYNYIRAMLNAALADDDVKRIIFDVNSPGGEAAGCPELSEEVYQARKIKPIIAVVDSMAYSGGYWIASACTKVILTPSGGTGSIGAIAIHFSVKGYYENAGIKITVLKAGDHKADGNPYEDLSASVKKEKLKTLEEIRATFVTAVARNRGLGEQVVRDTEARCYRAEEALELGLIDSIRSPAEAVSSILAELGEGDGESEDDDEISEDIEMTTTPNTTPPATTVTIDASAEQIATANKAGVTAEQTRIAGILDSEEAKGQEGLAKHFAFKTSMSADDAKAALAAASKDGAVTPPAKAPPAKAKVADEPNPFAAAMDAGTHPNLANGGEPDEQTEDGAKPKDKIINGVRVTAKGAGLLAAMTAATGRRVKVEGDDKAN